MSLTSELDKRQGPVRKFIESCFVIAPSQMKKDLPAEMGVRLSTVLVPSPPQLRGGALGTVGTAFDYRLRYYFESAPASPFAAHYGAAALSGEWPKVRLKDGSIFESSAFVVLDPFHPRLRADLVREFFDALDRFLARCEPRRRRLSAREDGTLARYCLVLALFEEVYRAAGTRYFDSPLYHLPHIASLEQLLALPSAEQEADVCALWTAMQDEHVLEGKDALCNPGFAGSGDVGGADADLILEGCLLEVKTASKPNLAEILRQLMGYVLLDYDDSYAIREVAAYLARQRCLVSFTLHELLIEHVGEQQGIRVRALHDGPDSTVEERLKRLRSEFRELLGQLREASAAPGG